MWRWLTKAVFGGGASIPLSSMTSWFGGLLGGNSPSGKRVTVDAAMQLSAVFANVRLISQTAASLPCMVYREDATGSRAVAKDHPLYALLHDRPNADMTAAEFWEAMFGCAVLRGNAFARIDRNVLGDVVALTPMAPDRVTMRRQPDGSLLYTFTPHQGAPEDFTEDQLFHLKGWSLDGMLGMSVVQQGVMSLGTALAAEEAAGKFFANGLMVSGFMDSGGKVLNVDQRDRYEAKMREFMGSSNAARTMLLEGGFKWVPVTMDPQAAQLLSTRQWSIEEICRWFGTDPSMIGHSAGGSKAPGSALEQEMLRFYQLTLRPWLTRAEQRARLTLLSPADRGRITIEFVFEGLMRADSAGRAALYAVMLQNGVQTRDEVRQLENFPRYLGDGADKLTVQSNLIPLDNLGKATPTQTPEGFGHPPAPQAAGAATAPIRQ